MKIVWCVCVCVCEMGVSSFIIMFLLTDHTNLRIPEQHPKY